MEKLEFMAGFKYPFNRAKGMLNILWMLLPIIGWFALGGYGIRIIKEFSKGKFKQLPAFKLGSDFKLGFVMFVKSLPFLIVYMISVYGILGMIIRTLGITWLTTVVDLGLAFFVVPMLTINFFNKETVNSYFELGIIKSVFANFGDYFVALLKDTLLGIMFLILSIVLVGIPAGVFTKNIFLADFYRRNVK